MNIYFVTNNVRTEMISSPCLELNTNQLVEKSIVRNPVCIWRIKEIKQKSIIPLISFQFIQYYSEYLKSCFKK